MPEQQGMFPDIPSPEPQRRRPPGPGRDYRCIIVGHDAEGRVLVWDRSAALYVALERVTWDGTYARGTIAAVGRFQAALSSAHDHVGRRGIYRLQAPPPAEEIR